MASGVSGWTGVIERLWRPFDFVRHCVRVVVRMARSYRYTCNLCGYRGGFQPTGVPPRMDARCPRCHSVERHRLLKLWLDANADFIAKADLLHFAPERGVATALKERARRYRTAGVDGRNVDLKLDIEAIDLPDAGLDCVLSSHVLEHVDDRRALSEMYRVLRPGGAAIIMIPVVEGWARTYENPAVKTDRERTRHYGQFDHVRYYGADVRERIREAGFALEEMTAEGEDVLTYGLLRGEKVFVARKPG